MPSFDAQSGTSPGVTILTAAGAVHTAHTTDGFTEAVAGSGVQLFAHPDPGTLLLFVFDATVDGVTYYASTWDDGLTTTPARAGDAMTLTAAYDAAKTAASAAAVAAIPTAPLLAVDYTAPDNASIAAIAADYAKTGEAATAVTGLATEANATANTAAVIAAVAGDLTDEYATVTHASADDDGDVMGITTGGATITAYLSSDTGLTTPKHQATAEPDGQWSIRVLTGATYVLLFEAVGYTPKEYTVTA